jgi:hypothetical protein
VLPRRFRTLDATSARSPTLPLMPHETIRLTGFEGIPLVADAHGEGDSWPVLLMHGGGQTRHAWGGQAAALARAGWRAVSLDLRGHGDSGWAPNGDYSFTSLGADCIAVCDPLGRPPVRMGASLGVVRDGGGIRRPGRRLTDGLRARPRPRRVRPREPRRVPPRLREEARLRRGRCCLLPFAGGQKAIGNNVPVKARRSSGRCPGSSG